MNKHDEWERADEKAKELASDPEYAHALIEDEDRRTRRDTVIRNFRLGIKRVCGRSAWSKIENATPVEKGRRETDRELGEFLKIRRQESRKFRKGDITLEVLLACMGELGWNWSHLEPMPAVADRIVGGYQAAIHRLRDQEATPDDAELDPETLIVGLALLVDEEVIAARKRKQLKEINWNAVADRVRPQVARLLNCPPEEVCNCTGKDMQRIRSQWSRWLLECRSVIPYRWLPEIEA